MNVLFMCVANSARSQMAEGLARHILGPHVEVQSAGSAPGKLNPFAVQVMREIGIDITHHHAKSIEDLSPQFLHDLNFVITLCAEEVCPVLMNSRAQRLHWPWPDPATKDLLPEEEMLTRFREARDGIAEKIKEFKVLQNL